MDPRAARASLRTIRILAALPDEALNPLVAAVKWIEVQKGQTIVAYLQKADSVFFIAAGNCQMKLTAPGDRPVILRRMNAGGHFGEIAALTRALRTVEVVAESECLLAECPREAFDSLMAADAPFARAIAASLARTVTSLTERVYEMSALQVPHRICAELLRLSRHGERIGQGILIQRLPRHESIAAAIGSQRAPVTRGLSSLVKEGLVKRNGRSLLIRDIDKLRNRVRQRTGPTPSDFDDG